MPTKMISVYPPNSLIKKITKAAKADGRSISSMFIRLAQEALKTRKEKNAPRF